jgi:hypothetical protein
VGAARRPRRWCRRPRPHGYPRYAVPARESISPSLLLWGVGFLVLGASDYTSRSSFCWLPWCARRARGAGSDAGEEAGAAEPSLEGPSHSRFIQFQSNIGMKKPVRCLGRWFETRFRDFLLTSPAVLCSASLWGSSWVTRHSWSTPASTTPGLPGSWSVALICFSIQWSFMPNCDVYLPSVGLASLQNIGTT